MGSPANDSVLPTTETDGAAAAAEQQVEQPKQEEEKPIMVEQQWRAVKSVLEALLNYRDETGHDPSRVFHKRVNKRFVPDYYDVIAEPMAFSNLKAKLASLEYGKFPEFVRDCALIWHNAHTYNRPDAGAYQDANTMKELMEKEFKRLVDEGTIPPEDAVWPDLGEIPPVEDVPAGEDDEEEEEEEEDDEDEEGEESEEEVPKKKKRGRPPLSAKRRDTIASEVSKADVSGKKKRGRPPKVDTPMEARIKNVLKGVRRIKNDEGSLVHTFEKLPEKTAMPEYYATIKQPMSVDQIKKSLKRKRYTSLDAFMKDVDLMFENAKLYNEDDSQIYHDAVLLQNEAHRLAEIERSRDDTEYIMDEGRKPRPNGIMHKGELWKVGDWVHIINANDVTKPIVAQLYRTWEDADGQEWVNACWYYRPEQTVHHFEKHFYPNEVVKTGQYRDHPIDDVIERCFVMFFTRYPKGRPRGYGADTKVYVCEARYNEEKHKMNKIKTWASCLPDETRDGDYEMDLFPAGSQRKIKKVPSPLMYMMEEEGKVTEEAPQPKWGMENAPPIVGGIFKGPRDEHQSPPPEPTPSPPPQPPPQPARPVMPAPGGDDSFGKADDLFKRARMVFDGETPRSHRRASDAPQQAAITPQVQGYTPGPGTPASQSHFQQPPTYTAPRADGTYSTHQATPQQVSQQQPRPFTPQFEHYTAATPAQSGSSFTPATQQPGQQAQQAAPRYNQTVPAPTPGGPRQADAYVLTDTENARIPEDVRARFHHDDSGRVMFFTKPPADVQPPERPGQLLGHTVQYHAAKIRREEALRERRAAREAELQDAAKNKRLKTHEAAEAAKKEQQALKELNGEMWTNFVKQMQEGTDEMLKSLHGQEWQTAKGMNEEKMHALQELATQQKEAIAAGERDRSERAAEEKRMLFAGPKVYKDDMDPRLARY